MEIGTEENELLCDYSLALIQPRHKKDAMKHKLEITRKGTGYIVKTDTFLSDGTYRTAFCELRGSRLVQSGFHIGSGFVTVDLSPAGLALVLSLVEGESVTK